MLVTSIFSFSHSLFCSIKEKNYHFVILATFNMLSANAFNLVMSKNLSFGEGLRVKSVSSSNQVLNETNLFFDKKEREKRKHLKMTPPPPLRRFERNALHSLLHSFSNLLKYDESLKCECQFL